MSGKKCATAGVPLIIDGAYGLPFPGMIYTPATPFWDDNTILCLSLSKLGLPGVRTGIVVAAPEVTVDKKCECHQRSRPNTRRSRACASSASERTVRRAVRADNQTALSSKTGLALDSLREASKIYPFACTSPTALCSYGFGSKISREALRSFMKRPRARVLSLSPDITSFRAAADWQHANECLRVNYAGDPAIVQEGIGVSSRLRDAYMKPVIKRPAPGSSPSGSVRLQAARTRAVAQYPAPAFREPWCQTIEMKSSLS